MNDKTNSLDYKNISLMITGEISSGYINRNYIRQPTKQPTASFMDNMEDDDEQFIFNLKKHIDENYKMQNKENFSIRDLQSKSYLLKRKKSAFTDEDQNLMKRFKKSVDESKLLNITPKKLGNFDNVNYFNNHNSSTIPTTAPLLTSVVAFNDINMNLRDNVNNFLFNLISKIQKDHQMTPIRTKTVTEIEIDELICHEMQYLTPPREID